MAKVKAPTIKLDAARILYLAQRTKRLFSIMQELDDLIEVLDDTGRLESAKFLITSFWEEERVIIQDFEDRIDDAFVDGLYGRDK